jgi:sigma-B regulation protein RsbU (phosphoserine phosphatase)
VEAQDGEKALAILSRKPIDIVVSDWMMPRVSGLELCRRVTADPGYGHPYFIMLTGRTEGADLVAGMDAGADDFVAKPAGGEELRVRLQAGLRVLKLRKLLQHRNQELRTALDRERASSKRLNEGLEAAARLQRGFLPNASRCPEGLSAACLYRPAEAIGGDALGLHDLGGGMAAFFLLDVCGHGIPAAMHSIGLARQLAPHPGEQSLLVAGDGSKVRAPQSVVARLNTIYCAQDKSDDFFTLAYGVLHVKLGKGMLCLAGHPRQLLLEANGRSHWLGEEGLPVGVLAEARHKSVPFRLRSGDRLILFSDGLVERGRHDRETAATAEALRSHLQQFRGAEPQAIVDALGSWLGSAEQLDDVAALVIGK